MIAFDPHSFDFSCSGVLQGGAAPESWRRDLRARSKLSAQFCNSGNWLKDLLNVDLNLSDCPLFGYALSSLVNLEAQPDELPERKTSSRPSPLSSLSKRELAPAKLDAPGIPSHTRIESPFKRKTRRDGIVDANPGSHKFNDDGAGSEDSAQATLQLAPAVDGATLRRLARPAADSGASPNAGPSRVMPIYSNTNQKSATRLHDAAPAKQTTSGPIEFAARRAEKALRRELARTRSGTRTAAPMVSKASLGETHDSETAGVAINLSSSLMSFLVDQWSMQVEGVRVSRALLNARANSHYAGQVWAEKRSAGGLRKKSPPEIERSSNMRTVETETDTLSSPAPDNLGGSVGLKASSEWRQPVSSEWRQRDPFGEDTCTTDSRSNPNAIPSSLVSPPAQKTETLSNSSTVPPLAARFDGVEAEVCGDDLTWLAEKMERLLNEEARRHGIDV